MATAAQTAPRRAGWRATPAGELVSECLGTFILICFGDGVVAMAVAALNQSGRGTQIFQASGDWLLIGWGWGFAVTFAVYVAGGVSGAHINPAVTLAFAARRGFPWRKVPSYIAAQVLGAFLGALLVYIVYKAAIDSYESANHITRGQANSVPTYSIFATFPAKYFGTWLGPFIDQIVGTAFLVGFVFAVVDEFNQPVRSNLAPVAIGFIVVAVGVSFGANAGYAINPARDFGPRLFAAIAGWGKIALPGDYGNVNTYFWIPIVGPFLGGLIGAFTYDFAIRDVLVARGEQPQAVEERGRTVEEPV
ncbi:MAG TPA: MIP family channel protein [Candidatus Limnocylindria bacterium]|jgi:glycerol uptake facilitator protein|nr:MIP family channel protein [Candidatus Limnocylindria bacterium]